MYWLKYIMYIILLTGKKATFLLWVVKLHLFGYFYPQLFTHPVGNMCLVFFPPLHSSIYKFTWHNDQSLKNKVGGVVRASTVCLSAKKTQFFTVPNKCTRRCVHDKRAVQMYKEYWSFIPLHTACKTFYREWCIF